MNDVFAVQDMESSPGAIVYWSLSGSVGLATLAEACMAEGLPMPLSASPQTQLRRAANHVYGAPRQLVRPLGRRGGVAVVREQVVEQGADEATSAEELHHSVVLTARLHEDGDLGAEAPEALRAAFQEAQAELSAQDVSEWLLRVMRALHAVPLRERGGLYFVPRSPALEAVQRVLSTYTQSRLWLIPAMRTDQAVAAVVEALTREVHGEVEAMRETMTELGARGLRRRQERLTRLEQKASMFAALLGVSLETLQAEMVGLQASLAVALLAATSEE